jgi:hypothetical protein
MFKIQIRSNGNMVDYDTRRFDSYSAAHSARVADKVAKRIWADMRVVAA